MKSYKKLEEDLIRSVQEENLNYVQKLVTQGADVHAWNDYALTMACRVGKQDMVEYFLDLGLNINTENGAPLRTVLAKRNIELLEYLIQQGAQVNIQELKSMFSKDKVILKWLKEQEYNQAKGISVNKMMINKRIDLIGLDELTRLKDVMDPLNTSEAKPIVETKEDSFKKRLRSLL